MPHARKLIRAAAVAALTGLATTGANVWAGRPQARPLLRSELPGLLVTTVDEMIQGTTIHAPGLLDRELQLFVVATVRELADLDDALDQIALEVETALGGGTLLDGRVHLLLEGIEAPQFDGAGEMPVARQVLRYRALYSTAADAPQTII